MAHERSDQDPESIVLPSGKSIEIVRLAEAAAPCAESDSYVTRSGAAIRAEDPQLCPHCDCSLVYPVAWETAPPDRWSVDLRCPNCERRDVLVLAQEAADRFDEQLERGAETLMTDLKRLTRANMADHVDRFVAALAAGAIQPMDF